MPIHPLALAFIVAGVAAYSFLIVLAVRARRGERGWNGLLRAIFGVLLGLTIAMSIWVAIDLVATSPGAP